MGRPRTPGGGDETNGERAARRRREDKSDAKTSNAEQSGLTRNAEQSEKNAEQSGLTGNAAQSDITRNMSLIKAGRKPRGRARVDPCEQKDLPTTETGGSKRHFRDTP